MGTSFPALLRRSEKSPARLSAVGTVEMVVSLVNWPVRSQVTKKKVFSLRMGPPQDAPYWFRRIGGRVAAKKLRALKTLFCNDSNRLPLYCPVPDRVDMVITPPVECPNSAE